MYMTVDRTVQNDENAFSILIDQDTAEALQTVLATVTDRTVNQGLYRLFTLLDARHVIAAKQADFEPDPNYDPDEPYGHDTMLVIGDLS
jgi:hypothetical protein